MNPKYILGAILLSASLSLPAQEPFHNPDLPVEQRVTDLLSRLTLEEKVNLMKHDAAAVPRLGIPAYNWWNEALHGVARTPEKVTVFPQAIAMAATFDPEGLQRVGGIASAARCPTRLLPPEKASRSTADSPTGHPTSTYSATRAGDADRKLTVKTPISRPKWVRPWCAVSRVPTRSI